MNGAVIHPSSKVTIAFTFIDAKDQPKEKENTIEGNKTNPKRLSAKEDQIHIGKTDGRPPLISRRTSSLLSLNIEGLLIVPEYEKRLRRKSYGGRESVDKEGKEADVDPSDGMLTTSLCTTEL